MRDVYIRTSPNDHLVQMFVQVCHLMENCDGHGGGVEGLRRSDKLFQENPKMLEELGYSRTFNFTKAGISRNFKLYYPSGIGH